MNISEEMEIAVAEFEAECGQVPRIESVEAMYAAYSARAKANGKSIGGIRGFIRAIARRGYMPVRLPDGSIGFFGIALKGKELIPSGSYQ